jgi:hypothetical protein
LKELALPLPLDGIDLKPAQLLRFPTQHLSAILEFGKAILTKDFCPVSTSLNQHCCPRMSFFGEDDVPLEPPGPVPGFGLSPLFGLGETTFDSAHDVKVLDIACAFGLAQRDQYIPLIPLLVAANHYAGQALVLRKNLAIASGVILKGDHIVLEEPDLLSPAEHGCFAFGIH